MVPSLLQEPVGCIFEPRCAYATERCRAEYPPFEAKAAGHFAACWESDRVAGAEMNSQLGALLQGRISPSTSRSEKACSRG